MARSHGPGDLLERTDSARRADDVTRRMRRAALLHLDGDTDEAARIYREVLADHPGHAVAHNNLGFLLAQLGLLDDAIAHYEAALATNPHSSMALTNLGNARIAQGDQDGLQLLESAVEAAADNPVAWDSLGRARLLFEDLEGAEEALRIAAHLAPDTPGILVTLGAVLGGQGRIGEAIATLEAAVERDPGAAAAWQQLGMVRFAHNDLGAAREALAAAGRLDPSRVDARRQLAVTLAALGETERAVVELRQLLDVTDRTDVMVDLAILELADGHHDRARARLAAIADEDNDRIRFHLALAELSCGDLKAAGKHFEALTKNDSRFRAKATEYLAVLATRSDTDLAESRRDQGRKNSASQNAR